MQRCKAREQVYFIDACRAISGKLLEGGYSGDPIIQPGLGAKIPEPWIAPIFYATLLGQEAYGRPASASVFTEALLSSFRGAASRNNVGQWRITSTGITEALNLYMNRVDDDYELVQIPSSNEASVIFLHSLDGDPVLPVLLRCDPSDANAHVEFSYGRKGSARSTKRGGPLDVEVPPGDYLFDWSFPTAPAGAAYQPFSLSPAGHSARIQSATLQGDPMSKLVIGVAKQFELLQRTWRSPQHHSDCQC